jgi:Protein of unknown function (DUF2800)
MVGEKFTADHAEFPPSSLGNMERCPGFRNRENEPSESAKRGTRIHKALETDSIQMLPSKHEIAVAQMCRDYMDAIIQERGVPFDQDIRERAGKMVMDLGGEDVKTFGTPDRILIYGDEAEMFDFKSGFLEIKDAAENPQAWAYTIGAFQKYPFLKSIRFHILIPNRDEVFHHTFTPDDLASMKLRLNTIIRRAMEFDWNNYELILKLQDRLNPQPELCEYCKNQTECPALAAKHLKVAAKVGGGLPIPESLQVSKDRPEDIAHILRLAPLLIAWATAQKKKALELTLKEGIEIPGFVRLSRKTDRSVKSVLGAWEALKDKIKLEEFLSACGMISIPELEEFFKKHAGKGQKGKAVRDMETKLRHAGVWGDQGDIFYLKEQKQ